MKQAPEDDFDARLDRVLREATTPRDDPAFRARVFDALDRPKPCWRAPLWRLAVPAAAVAALAVAVFAWTWSRPVTPVSEQQAQRQTTALPGGAESPAPPSWPHRQDDVADSVPAGRDTAGTRSAVVGGPTSRRPLRGVLDAAPASAGDEPPRIPPVTVARVSVDALEIEPLADTPALAVLESPERVEIPPIAIEALGPAR